MATTPQNSMMAMLSQMTPMGGVASPMQMYAARQNRAADPQAFRAMQAGPQLPDPMARAREHFLAARDQVRPVVQEFRSLRGPDRRDMLPELQAARQQFAPIKEWFHGLKDIPRGEAIGVASMGPPRAWSPPQLAEPMQVPQFAGLPQHNGTVEGLLAVLHEQNGGVPGGGGTGGGNGGDNLLPITNERTATPEQLEAYHRQLREKYWRDFNGGGRGSDVRSGT
jgi:hypothetical protein